MGMKLKEQIEKDGEPPAPPPSHAQAIAAPPLDAAPAVPGSAPAKRGRKPSATPAKSGRAEARKDKKATVGHFSKPMCRALAMLAAEREMTMQALMGEAWDLVLMKYGKKPFHED